MNREELLTALDRLVGLAERLPSRFREPFLRELTPVREIFLRARLPRLVLAGEGRPETSEFLSNLAGQSVHPGATLNGWTVWTSSEGLKVEVSDARRGDASVWNGALPPDLVVFFPSATGEAAAHYTRQMEEIGTGGISPVLVIGSCESQQMQILRSVAPAFSDVAWASVPEGEYTGMAEMMCSLVPTEARLELARFSKARKAQAGMAKRLLGSFSGICGVVALQPLPLADLPIITTLQSLMVSLIIYASGRKFDLRLVTEFFAALGINVGAAFLFRESARALLKVVPVAGNALSGGIAGMGTYAIGRAAIAYFVEGKAPTPRKKRFSLPFGRRRRE